MFGKERGDPIPESTELGSLLLPELKGIDKNGLICIWTC